MKVQYLGELQIQIFSRETGKYEPFGDFLAPNPEIAREIANGRPWRICKCDRPLKPTLRNHYPYGKTVA